MLIFTKLILAHFAADFFFQNRRFVDLKTRSVVWTLLHAAIFCLVAILLFASSPINLLIIAILGLGLLHFAVDVVKARCIDNSLVVFLADQAIHITIIGIASAVLQGITLHQIIQSVVYWFDSPKFLIISSALILATLGGSVFVSAVMLPFVRQLPEHEFMGLDNAGLYIGQFERLLVLVLTLTNNFAGIGFIFAAKSVIRFPEAHSEKHFAEYYLIGTMASFAFASLIGLVAKYILGHPSLFM